MRRAPRSLLGLEEGQCGDTPARSLNPGDRRDIEDQHRDVEAAGQHG